MIKIKIKKLKANYKIYVDGRVWSDKPKPVHQVFDTITSILYYKNRNGEHKIQIIDDNNKNATKAFKEKADERYIKGLRYLAHCYGIKDVQPTTTAQLPEMRVDNEA